MSLSFDLSAYLARIDYAGSLAPDETTLKALHRAHLLAAPYENLDVQFGRSLSTSPMTAFEKIVLRRRGGWCYEMNGVFGLALEALGFQVTRLSGSVLRDVFGSTSDASHLVLAVNLAETTWIADVGFGDGVIAPFRLAPGVFEQRGFEFNCEELPGGWWRMRNHRHAPRSFDFQLVAADERALSVKCASLQTEPMSVFVRNTIVQRHTRDGIIALRNRGFRRITSAGIEQSTVESAEEYDFLLRTEFGLDVPEAANHWPRICSQHDAAIRAT